MKRVTVSTYEDGCADQVDLVFLPFVIYCSFSTSFNSKEVLFVCLPFLLTSYVLLFLKIERRIYVQD